MTRISALQICRTLILLFGAAPAGLLAQWSHRYPQVKGWSHHVYLEGFELPLPERRPNRPRKITPPISLTLYKSTQLRLACT